MYPYGGGYGGMMGYGQPGYNTGQDNFAQNFAGGMQLPQEMQMRSQQMQDEQTMNQLRTAQLAEMNYNMNQSKLTAQGEDAYSAGTDGDSWKQFQEAHPGMADDIDTNHQMINTKKALLAADLVKNQSLAFGTALLPNTNRDEFNRNRDTIQKAAGNSILIPQAGSFKTDQDYNNWYQEMEGHSKNGLQYSSEYGKLLNDRNLALQKGDKQGLANIDQQIADLHDKAQAQASRSQKVPTGVIPPSATKALDAQLSKMFPGLEGQDKQAMIATAGTHYMSYIRQGIAPDQAMNNAIEDSKKGLGTSGFIFKNQTFNSANVPAVGGSSKSSGGLPMPKTATELQDGKQYNTAKGLATWNAKTKTFTPIK